MLSIKCLNITLYVNNIKRESFYICSKEFERKKLIKYDFILIEVTPLHFHVYRTVKKLLFRNVFRFTLDSFRNNTQHEQQHKEHWWWFCCSHNDACGLLILHYQSHVVRWFHLTGSNKFERVPPRVHFLPFLLYLSSYLNS